MTAACNMRFVALDVQVISNRRRRRRFPPDELNQQEGGNYGTWHLHRPSRIGAKVCVVICRTTARTSPRSRPSDIAHRHAVWRVAPVAHEQTNRRAATATSQ